MPNNVTIYTQKEATLTALILGAVGLGCTPVDSGWLHWDTKGLGELLDTLGVAGSDQYNLLNSVADELWRYRMACYQARTLMIEPDFTDWCAGMRTSWAVLIRAAALGASSEFLCLNAPAYWQLLEIDAEALARDLFARDLADRESAQESQLELDTRIQNEYNQIMQALRDEHNKGE